jgi:hypothetical protein
LTTYKVALAQFPGGGSSRMETNAWVVQTVRAMDRHSRISEVVSLTYNDTPITMTRNRAVKDARAAGCDYLLMVDNDLSPDCIPGAAPFWETAWAFMMERRKAEREQEKYYLDSAIRAERPLHPESEWPECVAQYEVDAKGSGRSYYPPATVAAPYCGPSPEQSCYVFHWASPASGKPEPQFRLEMIPRESAAIRSGIEEVAALPTGLILYDMRVFDVLPPPWFRYEWGDVEESIKASTEDVYQTRNASLLGLPQYCAWDCWAAHVKTETVGKPVVLTRDMIHASLVAAVERGVDRGDRLVILPPAEEPEPKQLRSAAEADARNRPGRDPRPGVRYYSRDGMDSAVVLGVSTERNCVYYHRWPAEEYEASHGVHLLGIENFLRSYPIVEHEPIAPPEEPFGLGEEPKRTITTPGGKVVNLR